MTGKSIHKGKCPGYIPLVVKETESGRELSQKTQLPQSDQFLYVFDGKTTDVEISDSQTMDDGPEKYGIVNIKYQQEGISERSSPRSAG